MCLIKSLKWVWEPFPHVIVTVIQNTNNNDEAWSFIKKTTLKVELLIKYQIVSTLE